MRQAAGLPAGAKSFVAAEELKLLRRELDQVRMAARDILKKAAVGSGDQRNTL
jgi:hypothetical protein